MKETELVKQIMEYLYYKPGLFFRVNSGAFKTQAGGFYRFCSINGVSDILGVYKGKFVAIECKVGRNKTSPAQDRFLNAVKENGGIVIVAYSLDDVEKIIN